MNIEDMKMLLQPDREPCERPTVRQWIDAEIKLGIELPSDYKQFISYYGTGIVAKFLRVLNPTSSVPGANLEEAATSDRFDGYWTLRQKFPEQYPLSRFPEKEGLLPWGSTINGDVLYWLTQGCPDLWPIVVWHRGLRRFWTFQTNFVGFMGDLLLERSPLQKEDSQQRSFPRNVPFRDGIYTVAGSDDSP